MLTIDNINCSSTVTSGTSFLFCQTIDQVKCITDQTICDSAIVQGISEIKGLLANGVSCSVTSCDSSVKDALTGIGSTANTINEKIDQKIGTCVPTVCESLSTIQTSVD
jgi:hypothetical protein